MRKSSPAPGKFTCPRKLSVPRRVQGMIWNTSRPSDRCAARADRNNNGIFIKQKGN